MEIPRIEKLIQKIVKEEFNKNSSKKINESVKLTSNNFDHFLEKAKLITKGVPRFNVFRGREEVALKIMLLTKTKSSDDGEYVFSGRKGNEKDIYIHERKAHSSLVDGM